LVNVDAASPSRGQRTPIVATFRADKTSTIGANRLVVHPYPGFGLDEGTTYALVVTDRLHGTDGTGVHAAADFTAVRGTGGDAAIVQRTEHMRFSVSVPPGPTPATGWPICIYAHGTGGNVESFVEDDTAHQLAGEGIAVISTDQVLHGPRNPGGDPASAFFN